MWLDFRWFQNVSKRDFSTLFEKDIFPVASFCFQFLYYQLPPCFTHCNILVIRIFSSHINTSTSSTGKWKTIHPSKLTWNLKMNPWKRRFLLETIIFRFHVTLPGGGGCSPSFASNWASGQPAREPLRAACRIRGFLTVFRCWWHGSSDDMLSNLEAFHNLKISQCFIFLSLKRSLMVLASQAAQVVSLPCQWIYDRAVG